MTIHLGVFAQCSSKEAYTIKTNLNLLGNCKDTENNIFGIIQKDKDVQSMLKSQSAGGGII